MVLSAAEQMQDVICPVSQLIGEAAQEEFNWKSDSHRFDDDKPTACNASVYWREYVNLAIERGFDKVFFQASGWQTRYWPAMVELLERRNNESVREM